MVWYIGKLRLLIPVDVSFHSEENPFKAQEPWETQRLSPDIFLVNYDQVYFVLSIKKGRKILDYYDIYGSVNRRDMQEYHVRIASNDLELLNDTIKNKFGLRRIQI